MDILDGKRFNSPIRANIQQHRTSLASLLVLWIMFQMGPLPCRSQCMEDGLSYCNVGVINMTSDGGVKLRTTIETIDDDVLTINIDQLIVGISASGPFLQRIAAYTETITYAVYRDPVFQIPNGNTIEEIELNGAGVLRTIVAGTNNHLKRLQVERCLLDRLPPTLHEMGELTELIIMRCALSALRLDMLLANSKLTIVDLSQNKIRQILPVTTAAKHESAIVSLSFIENLLERLDMAAFAMMPNLQSLDLWGNRIVRFEATAPVTYPSLSQLYLVANEIAYFDARNLSLPSLEVLLLNQNALTEVPAHWGVMPRLKNLGLEENKFKQVDMSVFRMFPELTGIYLGQGEIESVRTSSPVVLPILADLLLEQNKLVSVNLTGCTFPNMHTISLVENRLTAIPPLFQHFPKMSMLAISNPIKCSNVVAFKKQIVAERLYVSVGTSQYECDTTSSIELDPSRRICCDA
uniref:Leucine rich immune protein (Coil-less) n=1 Tax=Anopheles farauti TaxID=69004 RepID=A0A182QGK2_9DIPT